MMNEMLDLKIVYPKEKWRFMNSTILTFSILILYMIFKIEFLNFGFGEKKLTKFSFSYFFLFENSDLEEFFFLKTN